MNIAIVKESLCLGGTERSVSNISQALDEKYKVSTVLFDEKNIQYPYGGKLIGISAPPAKTFLGKVLNSFIRSYKLRKIVKKENIDVLMVFTSVTGTLLHEPFFSCKKIISCRDFGKLSNSTKKFAHAVKNSDAIIFNSNYQRDFYLRHYPNDVDKCFVSYNIISKEHIVNQASELVEKEYNDFLNTHSINIVAVGRFCYEKGFEHLINAFKIVHDKFNNIGLILIGDGDYRNRYDKLIDEYHLKEDVYFTGFKMNPYKYIAKCDLFVLSSISEGFPNVVPEAMACGLPVICANCLTGPAEILSDKYDYNVAEETYCICDYGILTPKFGVDEKKNNIAEAILSDAILEVIRNKELRKYMINRSLARVNYFTKEAAISSLGNVISYVTRSYNDKN